MRSETAKLTVVLAIAAVAVTFGVRPAWAHCDTLDGPVVKDARAALEAGDETLVLKWVAPEGEPEVRRAFEQTLLVRGLGPEAQALADRFFFETLVRVHREGEGAPYTGLKAAGTPVDPAVGAAEHALESGAVEPLVELIAGEIDEGLRKRHARAVRTRSHAGEGVEQGRQYVAAYVDLMHYAEGLLAAAGSAPHAHAEHAP